MQPAELNAKAQRLQREGPEGDPMTSHCSVIEFVRFSFPYSFAPWRLCVSALKWNRTDRLV